MPKRFHILIVDDEESITFLLKTEFEELKEFEIDTAPNGAEAIILSNPACMTSFCSM